MKILVLIPLIIGTLSAFAFNEATINALQVAIDKQTSQKRSVGIAVGIIEGNKRLILTSGLKNLEQNLELTGDEYFSIGSVSKTFTSLLLSSAVTNHKVHLDEKVENILPIFKGDKIGKITLRQLSTHSSGLQRGPNDIKQRDYLIPFENYKKERLIKQLFKASITKVEDRMLYSNLGIALLVLCLEEIYNGSFDVIIREHILSPLGLDNIKIKITDDFLPYMSHKYFPNFESVPIWKDLGIFNGVGSFKSDASIMLDYIEAQLFPKKTSLSKAILNSQKTIHSYKGEKLAYAWTVREDNGEKVFWHNGSTRGFLTDLFFIPSQKKGLIVFNNSGNSTKCVGEIFFEGKLDCKVADVTFDTKSQLAEYAGLYRSSKYKTIIKVEPTEHGFQTIQVIGQAKPVRLFKITQNRYEFFEGEGKIFFKRDSHGQVLSMRLIQGSNIDYSLDKQ